MKAKKYIKILSLIFLLFVINACYDYEVKTIINPDCSCKRMFTVKGDSISDFFSKQYPIPVDTSWNLDIDKKINKNGEPVFIYNASKEFKNIQQINQSYLRDTGVYAIVKRSIKLNKKFRWFYTAYYYKEEYQQLFNQVSINQFIGSLQYHYIMLPEKEQEEYLKEKFDTTNARVFKENTEAELFKWMGHVLINSCFKAFEQSFESLNYFPVNKKEIEIKKDSLLNLVNKQMELSVEDENVIEIVKRVLKTDNLHYPKIENQDSFIRFLEKYRFWEETVGVNKYKNLVAMPGKIYENNGKVLSSNEVEWEVDWIKYFTDDYQMVVKSEVLNIWLIWLTGGVLLGLIISFLIKKETLRFLKINRRNCNS